MIKGEEDLHNYKNLLNAMAALFYTNHKMVDVQGMFKEWISLWKKNKNAIKKPRAIPEIDTELANAQYENANEMDDIE